MSTKPIIPNRSNRKEPFTFNKRLYKLRWRIEPFRPIRGSSAGTIRQEVRQDAPRRRIKHARALAPSDQAFSVYDEIPVA